MLLDFMRWINKPRLQEINCKLQCDITIQYWYPLLFSWLWLRNAWWGPLWMARRKGLWRLGKSANWSVVPSSAMKHVISCRLHMWESENAAASWNGQTCALISYHIYRTLIFLYPRSSSLVDNDSPKLSFFLQCQVSILTTSRTAAWGSCVWVAETCRNVCSIPTIKASDYTLASNHSQHFTTILKLGSEHDEDSQLVRDQGTVGWWQCTVTVGGRRNVSLGRWVAGLERAVQQIKCTCQLHASCCKADTGWHIWFFEGLYIIRW